jgi:hypothetical protein
VLAATCTRGHESPLNGDFVSQPRFKSRSKRKRNPRHSRLRDEYRTKGRRLQNRSVRTTGYAGQRKTAKASEVGQQVSENDRCTWEAAVDATSRPLSEMGRLRSVVVGQGSATLRHSNARSNICRPPEGAYRPPLVARSAAIRARAERAFHRQLAKMLDKLPRRTRYTLRDSLTPHSDVAQCPPPTR